MKPTNLSSNEGCSPISSTCVKWQGGNIKCITLCKGASLDDVITEMGCLVCNIKDQLSVDTYDLECFDLPLCEIPRTFRELMQFLLEKVCHMSSNTSNGGDGNNNEADAVITVASCFQSNNGYTMSLSEYVKVIGLKVCEQNVTIENQQKAIKQLVDEVNRLKLSI